MINDFHNLNTITDVDREAALQLQSIDAFKANPGPALTHAARRLAQIYIGSIGLRGLSLPTKVVLFFEVEDADDAAAAFADVLSNAGIGVVTACFWVHRRRSSFDRVIVETTRAHIEDISDVDTALILQPGLIRPEAIRAFLIQTEGKLDATAPIVVLSPWSAPDIEAALEATLPPTFLPRLALGYFASGGSSAESILHQSTQYSSSQRKGFPAGWDKNDYYPNVVRLAIQKQMKRTRDADAELKNDGP